MNLDTAIRISAQVQGANNIRSMASQFQQLNAAAQLSGRQLDKLYTETQRFAAAAGGSINSLRQQRQALMTLRDAADPVGRRFQMLGRDIEAVDAKLRRLNAQPQRLNLREAFGSAGGAMAMGGGPGAAMGALGGSLAAAGGPAGMAIAGGIVASGALTAASVNNARELEAQSRRLRVMTGDAEMLQERIIALTREQGYLSSTTEATAAAYEILQAGFSDTDDILKVLRASTLGAVGGFTDIKTVADATTSILNGYGLTAADAGRVVDQMKASTDDGKISMEAYAQSIGKVVPSAAAAKVPLEQVNAAISALTAQGVPVETTFSGLNQVLKTILKPTDEARKLAAALGLEFNAQALAAKGLGGFLADVAAKTGKSTDALSVLFSDIDGYKAVVALLNDDLQRFNRFTDNQADALGRSAKAASLASDSVKQFDNAWKDFSATLGQLALPAINGVLNGLTGMMKALIDMPKAIQRIDLSAFASLSPDLLSLGAFADAPRRSTGGTMNMQPPAVFLRRAQEQQRQQALAPITERATTIARQLAEGADKEADKAAKAQKAAADRVADHQRQLQEANAEEARRLAEGEFRARQQMDQVLHEQRMQQLDRERAAQRELMQARMELAIAQTPEQDRWILEFRQRLLGIVADSGERILDIQRQISDKQQQIKAAQERLRFEQQTAQPRVITTGGGGGGGAVGAGLAVSSNSTVSRLMDAANRNLGLFAGQTERCADAIRVLFREAGVAIGTTRKAWDKMASGPSLASSFFGADIGQRINRQSDLRPGDLVGFERTYGQWGPGVQTHVGMYAGGGMMFDHSSRRGLVKRPLSTFAGKFMYGVRPTALGGQPAAAGATTATAAAQAPALQTVLPPSRVEMQSSGAEVAQLTAELNGLEQQLTALQKAEGPLTGVQMLTEGVRQLEQLNQPMAQLARDAGDRLAFEREYGDLLSKGINPELAREYATVESTASLRAKKLQQLQEEARQLAQLPGLTEKQRSSLEQIASLSGQYLQSLQGQTTEIKEQIRQTQELQRLQGLRQDTRIGEGIREGAQEYVRQIGTMRQATAQLTVQGLQGLEDALVSVATTGKANWQEFASAMLASTARVIIQQMVLRVLLQAIGGIGGGGGSAAAASFELPPTGFPTSGFGPSFAGGGGTGNGPRAGGLDGRGGYMAVLHPQEVVVDRYDRRQLPGITRQLLADDRVREEITRQLSERSTVNVAGVDRLATVNQGQRREASVVNLAGIERLATVNQGQRREVSTVNLAGVDRLATVNQGQRREVSTVNVAGVDRLATVNQGQRREASVVNLAGIERLATVNQGQRREVSTVNLAGVDRLATVNQGQRREVSTVNISTMNRSSTVNRQELRELITEQAANQIRHISRRPAMPSYAGGGYTGNAPRAGGLDGQGGFLAMLHPRETVVDHTRGQAATAPAVINVTVNNDGKAADVQGSNDQNSRRLAADLAAVIDARLQHHKRPGGLLHGGRR